MRSFRFSFLLGSLLSGMLFSCRQAQRQDLSLLLPKDYGTGQVMEGVRTKISEQGRAVLTFETTKQEDYSKEVRFDQGIRITYYAQDGQQVKAILKADKGRYDKEKDTYFARCDVQVQNFANRETLYTSELIWKPQQHRIYTEKPIEIHTQDEVHKGEGLIASEDFEEYRILRPQGTLTLR